MARKSKTQYGSAVPAIAESYYMRKKREREEALAATVTPLKEETDEEIEARMDKAFKTMDLLAHNTINGSNKSLIISGPPGLGKSYTVMKAAEDAIGERLVTTVKGFVRPTGLYRSLYEQRFPQCTIVFDDSDSVFQNDVSLNLLKNACDITRERKLSWLAETKMLDEDGDRLPRNFLFEGSIIFITNYDFDELIARGNILAPHMQALVSRSQYVDLAIKSKRDCLIRIKQVVRAGMLAGEGLDKAAEDEIVDFVEENQDKLRELSLRMVIKIANTRRDNRFNWREIAYIANVPASKR